MVNPRSARVCQDTGLMRYRASTPFLALQGERTAQDGFKMVRSVVLGGNLSCVTWQDGFPPDNPNMGAFVKGIHARFINKV